MAFWKMAYDNKWVTLEQLRLVVKNDTNLFGQITELEFKAITGQEF